MPTTARMLNAVRYHTSRIEHITDKTQGFFVCENADLCQKTSLLI